MQTWYGPCAALQPVMPTPTVPNSNAAVQGGGGSSAGVVGVDNAASSSSTFVGPGNVILQVRLAWAVGESQ